MATTRTTNDAISTGARVTVVATLPDGRKSEFHGEHGTVVPEPAADGGVPGLIPVLLDRDRDTGVVMYFTVAQLRVIA